jgi:hypothetical protein
LIGPGTLSDEFFKEVEFCETDDWRIIYLARHALSLVHIENLTTITTLAGSTPTPPGQLTRSPNCMAPHSRLSREEALHHSACASLRHSHRS